MTVSKNAMREGILYDMLGRASDSDPRDASIQALAVRYGVDAEQAARVEASALRLFSDTEADWKLDDEMRRMLGWACRIHEIGLAIAHSQYHQHGAYLVEHSDIAGFSRQEQQVLAALVRNQRRSIAASTLDALPEALSGPTLLTLVLLRLAVLLHRSHEPTPLPSTLRLTVDGRSIRLRLPSDWLASHSLTRSDLDTETELLAAVGLDFGITAD